MCLMNNFYHWKQSCPYQPLCLYLGCELVSKSIKFVTPIVVGCLMCYKVIDTSNCGKCEIYSSKCAYLVWLPCILEAKLVEKWVHVNHHQSLQWQVTNKLYLQLLQIICIVKFTRQVETIGVIIYLWLRHVHLMNIRWLKKTFFHPMINKWKMGLGNW
jgi:hypothetical protein